METQNQTQTQETKMEEVKKEKIEKILKDQTIAVPLDMLKFTLVNDIAAIVREKPKISVACGDHHVVVSLPFRMKGGYKMMLYSGSKPIDYGGIVTHERRLQYGRIIRVCSGQHCDFAAEGYGVFKVDINGEEAKPIEGEKPQYIALTYTHEIRSKTSNAKIMWFFGGDDIIYDYKALRCDDTKSLAALLTIVPTDTYITICTNFRQETEVEVWECQLIRTGVPPTIVSRIETDEPQRLDDVVLEDVI